MTWCLCIPSLRPAFCFSFSFFWHARLHHYWWFHLLATPETENILSINYQWFLVKVLLLLLDSKEDIQVSGFGWYSMSCCPAFIGMVIVSEIFSKDWNYKLQPLSIFQTVYNCFFILLHFQLLSPFVVPLHISLWLKEFLCITHKTNLSWQVLRCSTLAATVYSVHAAHSPSL